MRFFLDLFSCGGSATQRCSDSTTSTKPLVPPRSQTLRRKKRDAPDWRPSLGSISEDSAVAESERRSGRDVKRRSTSAAHVAAATVNAKVQRHRNYSDAYDNGRVAMPTIMPPFSPTPFMF